MQFCKVTCLIPGLYTRSFNVKVGAVTQRDIKAKRSYQIALKQGNQNPQNDNMIASFSFASAAHELNGRII